MSAPITFSPAHGKAKKILAAVSGGTGSGKTYSALEVGTGLVVDPTRHLFLIDTEFGRAAHYANTFKFQYGQLSPPFRPERYIAAIDAAIAAGAECVIVDSLSHMWEGEDGLLDWHGDIALKMARGDEQRAETYNFPAWRLPKQELQKFVLYLQRCPVHLILCLRAKAKSKMVRGKDGRMEIVDAGLQPIIDTATPYEATFLAMLTHEEPGVPHWTHKALASYLQPLFANGPKALSREHGRRLAEWCNAGAPAVANDQGEAAEAQQSADVPPPAGAAPGRGQRLSDRCREIDAIFRAEQTLAGLNRQEARFREEMAAMPERARTKLAEAFHECREALMRQEPPGDDGRTFHDDVAHLEPEEWRQETGRVEDERQGEML